MLCARARRDHQRDHDHSYPPHDFLPLISNEAPTQQGLCEIKPQFLAHNLAIRCAAARPVVSPEAGKDPNFP